jgi:hypothetical protein
MRALRFSRPNVSLKRPGGVLRLAVAATALTVVGLAGAAPAVHAQGPVSVVRSPQLTQPAPSTATLAQSARSAAVAVQAGPTLVLTSDPSNATGAHPEYCLIYATATSSNGTLANQFTVKFEAELWPFKGETFTTQPKTTGPSGTVGVQIPRPQVTPNADGSVLVGISHLGSTIQASGYSYYGEKASPSNTVSCPNVPTPIVFD